MRKHMTYVIKVYLKHKLRCFATVECGEDMAAQFDTELSDDAITMLILADLRIPKSEIRYVEIKEVK